MSTTERFMQQDSPKQRTHVNQQTCQPAFAQTAAGWSSGAMVARYTSAMSAELAIEEFMHF